LVDKLPNIFTSPQSEVDQNWSINITNAVNEIMKLTSANSIMSLQK